MGHVREMVSLQLDEVFVKFWRALEGDAPLRVATFQLKSERWHNDVSPLGDLAFG